MRTLFTSTLVVTAIASLLGSFVAAQDQSIPVVTPRPADVVLESPATGPGGKVLTTTDSNGHGIISDADAKLMSGKFDVYEETCPDKDRYVFVPAGGQTPDPDSSNCKKRKVVTVLVKPGAPLNLGSSVTSTANTANKLKYIVPIAGAGAVAALLLTKNNTTASTPVAASQPSSQTMTYVVPLNAITNSCNLTTTTTAQLVVSGGTVLQGTESIGGTSFTFNFASSNGTSFSGSSVVTGSQTFSITTTITFSSANVSMTQTVNGASSLGTCITNYAGTAS